MDYMTFGFRLQRERGDGFGAARHTYLIIKGLTTEAVADAILKHESDSK